MFLFNQWYQYICQTQNNLLNNQVFGRYVNVSSLIISHCYFLNNTDKNQVFIGLNYKSFRESVMYRIVRLFENYKMFFFYYFQITFGSWSDFYIFCALLFLNGSAQVMLKTLQDQKYLKYPEYFLLYGYTILFIKFIIIETT